MGGGEERASSTQLRLIPAGKHDCVYERQDPLQPARRPELLVQRDLEEQEATRWHVPVPL